MTSCWGILIFYPVVDLILAVIWFTSVASSWRGFERDASRDELNERTLAATVVMGQLNAVITGTSIIVAGIGAFVALSASPPQGAEQWHLGYAATWAVTALALSMYTLATLPTRTPTRSFVQSASVSLMSAMALYFGIAAGVRFVFAVWSAF